ncbi:MAG: DUF998 domain-containing protein [Candidatus Aegiribacteria sp.]|nr:DUF998 domain-containing protein [Candidatus Aegiribacteria sp.]
MKKSVGIIPLSGFMGAGLIAAGALIAAVAYRGSAGESYCILNHFISELGDVGVSRLAGVFNVFLIAGALCLTVFLVGLARLIGGRIMYLFLLTGLVTGISGALVGIFPMNHLKPHLIVAMLFFDSAMITIILFSVWVILTRHKVHPRWLALMGLMPAACLFSFIFLRKPISEHGPLLAIPEHFTRPDFWPTAAMEWSVLISILTWVIVVALTIRKEVRCRT